MAEYEETRRLRELEEGLRKDLSPTALADPIVHAWLKLAGRTYGATDRSTLIGITCALAAELARTRDELVRRVESTPVVFKVGG